MLKYRSHKVVEAAEIERVPLVNNGVGLFPFGVAIREPLQDGRYCIHVMVVPVDFFGRGTPEPGDYFVQYDDGYVSWSPKKQFEDGYTLVVSKE